MKITHNVFCLVAVMVMHIVTGYAQQAQSAEEIAYTKTINQRATKIVNTLSITDSTKANRVQVVIVNQYRSLNAIHTASEGEIKKIKSDTTQAKEKREGAIKSIEETTSKKLDKLHNEYISSLSKELTVDQIDQVKDGMTYGVLPITYKGYQDMIPQLTAEQKAQLLAYLIEARDHAMDAGSSDKKHWWFGKYKGKINNYLSSQGYNMKQESENWEKRRKAAGEKL